MKLMVKRTRRIVLGCLCASALLCSFTKPDHTELPRIWFTENTARIVEDSAFYAKKGADALPVHLLNWIANTLKENPTAVMNILGYADGKENEPTNLGLRRSLLIRDSLVVRGIAAGRLIATSEGDTKPLIDDHTITRMTTTSEKAFARQQNRRVEFNIISFDWKP